MNHRNKQMSERQHTYYITNRDAILARQKFLRAQDPEKVREQNKAYYRRKKPMFLNRYLKANYGCTLEHYEKLLNSQCRLCAICRKPASSFKRALCVDHDHVTGKIRGLLCINCNLGLGCFNDKIELLKEAVDYIRGGPYAVPV